MTKFDSIIKALQELDKDVEAISNIGKEELKAINKIQEELDKKTQEGRDLVKRIKM